MPNLDEFEANDAPADHAYLDHGDQKFMCGMCNALLWEAESKRGKTNNGITSYSLSCSYGDVQLPDMKDTESNSEVLDNQIINYLKDMLDSKNPLVNSYRMARDCFQQNPNMDLKLKIIGTRQTNARTYNLPTTSEVAALIVGDIGEAIDKRDIIVTTQSGALQRISELHPCYVPLQYPILFPYGEDGYRIDMAHRELRGSTKRKRKKCTMREFFSYQFQDRPHGFSLILNGGILTQQLFVDAYTMIETQRLHYVRTQQKKLRSETYENLRNIHSAGTSDVSTAGQRIILPSSFTGGARYMMQNYLDAMTICRWFGYPDFFLTITCNPNWPEIKRFLLNKNQKSEDRPDILCRLFKMKLDSLMKDLKDRALFGKLQAVVYTIEFQKSGLPHAHIYLFLHSEHKIHNPENTDKFISAEIPDPNEDPEIYSLVTDHMMHGPCGVANPKCPCMVDNSCSKKFPKKFQKETSIDSNGFPVYRRIDLGNVVVKYLSACEAAWRIFAFDVHYRVPSVTRLPFHLPRQQTVVFVDDDDVEDVLNKPSVGSSKFIAWMECNRDACYKRGLLDDDNEYIEATEEASHTASGYYLRSLFATMLITYSLSRPDDVWEKCWHYLIDGILYKQQNDQKNPDLVLSETQLKNLALLEIENFLLRNNCTLRCFPTMPFPDDDNICNLINKTDLIIWDEAPMIHKHAFKALDRTLKDVIIDGNRRNCEHPFGGKVIVFGGDFRQILPVVQNGSRSDIVNASLSSSHIWTKCKVLRLTKNMRLTVGCQSSNLEDTIRFAEWLLELGEGKLGDDNDGNAIIEIPDDFLIRDSNDPLSDLIDFLYPALLEKCNDIIYFQERAILAPLNEVVE
ncbi:uncharacterized protein LOC143555409 [Bidens hawaiensis]|uniref:uncharacterized protein LOC143555409 n=1 Tax=Bidens hawaiensis TaxID=980011 RepID=UPI00404AED78